VLLPGAGHEQAEGVASDLVELVRLAAASVAPRAGVAASAGVALVQPDHGVPSAGEVLAAADGALYRAKRSGQRGPTR
jgi:PleD family two-component response regulator